MPLLTATAQGTLNSVPDSGAKTNHVLRIAKQGGLRLSNTSMDLNELQRSGHAILLENAVIDTLAKIDLAIPDDLRAKGDPGTYIVQRSKPLDGAFYDLLNKVGATYVSFIPVNACLVRATDAVAQQLRSAPNVQAVTPYEPYYKLMGSMLQRAVSEVPVPTNSPVNLLLFGDAKSATMKQLQDLGIAAYEREETPFGPVITVVTPKSDGPASQPGHVDTTDFLASVAGLPGVQEMEWATPPVSANDLSRVSTGVATNTLVPDNYLNLTGTNIVVNVNDSGVDATQPDLLQRVNSPTTNGLVDPNGHGTHVAGIIASSGAHSTTPINVGANASGSISNASFRGKAPAAGIYSLPISMFTGPYAQGALFWPPDSYLQETPAKTNIFISNNSWNYVGSDAQKYDLHAASYDAAVRDALPFVTGSQPVLFVFSAGNAGGGNNQGTSGGADTIQSPGTAKNVITVGAVEQLRNITNQVTKCSNTDGCVTNTPWLLQTDADDQVAGFSSRGNVGIGTEGQYGRFKPDLVAPGVFVVSTRSQQWDTNSYYNPTSHIYVIYEDIIVETNELWYNGIFVPQNAVQLNISVFPNTNSPIPFPPTPIYIKQSDFPTNPPPDYDYVGTNSISLPPDHGLSPVGAGWFYALGNDYTQRVHLNLLTDIVVTNDLGNYLDVLAGMNNALGPDYRYESGTSMAAAEVSGTLALMQEFFQRVARTNSPALMKALLINGARSVGPLYSLNTRAQINYQGWGLINLPTTIPGALTNITANTNAIFVVDQSPTNSLATGDSRTFKVTLTTPARNQRLRATLVWTDPPGNPVASVKLVNDLDLVVTNLDNTNLVFYGNDIPSGHSDSNVPWNTNGPPNLDTVNNVENVFLSPDFGENSLLATNYSITVVGRRVNVNAVTAQSNNIVQDFALVISCGDSVITNGLALDATAPIVSVTAPLVTVITNIYGAASTNYSGGILLNQHVGANPPLLGTNSIILTNNADGVLTLGMTNQWHFYAITNENGFTNAAFLTFLPPTLSIPRMGVFANSEGNSTRPEADIDLFVAPPSIPNNFALTNLDPAVVAASTKSFSRGGTETIIYSNATPGVYYIGVKSEDQMAAEYGLVGVFSRYPFGSSDDQGNQTLIGIPAPAAIPDGSPDHPGAAYIFAIAAEPVTVRRVVVTNTIQHELMSDLQGALTHNGQVAVLNNHTCVFDQNTFSCQTCTTFIYDDSDEKNVSPGITICPPQVQPSDGPGSLNNFAGLDGTGQWMLTMVDNATNHVGTNILLQVYLEKQQDLAANGVTFTLQPGACRNDFITVPINAISMSITAAVVTATPPIDFTLTVCPQAGLGCKSVEVTNAVGGGVTTDLTDQPPLLPGTTYTVRTCNLGLTAITINLRGSFTFSEDTILPVLSTNTVQPVNIVDDAVTDIYLTNDVHAIITSLDIGLLINDPRISDLAITLISPNGTRILLFENRGGTSTNGLGTFNIITNYVTLPFYTNNFDLSAVGPYFPGAIFQGWNVLSNSMEVLDDYACLCLSNHILSLMAGGVSNTIPTTNTLPVTNLMPYSLSFNVTHAPGLEGMVTWWPLDTNGVDIFGGFNGLLLGDVAFSTGLTNALYDEFSGPLSNNWSTPLPTASTAAGPSPIMTYGGPPAYTFTTIGTNTVLRMANTLGSNQRVGWISTNIFRGQTFRYEVRFNTLTQGPGVSSGGFIEIWLLDPTNPTRFDLMSPFGGAPGPGNVVYMGSSFEGSYNSRPFNYQNNTWYRLVISAAPGQGIRMQVLSDAGLELAGVSFIHGMSDFPAGFQIGLSQFMGTLASGTAPVAVAVDSVIVKSGLAGEVNQAYYGDGTATRMIVPRAPELNLGLGRGLSVEGWIRPVAASYATTYDARADFSTNSNPNGAWRYSWSDGLAGAQHLFPRAIKAPINNNLENMWYDPANNQAWCPSVALNTGGAYNDGNVTFNAGALIMHPCGTNGLAYAHTIWTAPAKGLYSVASTFYAQQNAINVDVKVRVNSTVVYSSTITQNGTSVSFATNIISLAAGDTIDFAVGPNNNFVPHAGNTGLEAVIKSLSIVSPEAGPIVEWNASNDPFPPGLQFGVGVTNGAGTLSAIIWDTNLVAHVISTQPGVITNAGWQHVALTYDTNSGIANLYLNGLTNNLPLVSSTLGRFVPRTFGDVYLGYHPGTGTNSLCFSGGLDEFSLYDRALSPCEVGAIYGAGMRGKYGTNALVCPVQTEVTLITSGGPQTFNFTNGLTWTNNGPFWETNVINFTTSGTNPTPIIVRGKDPFGVTNINAANNLNVALDNFVLSGLSPQYFNGMLHFTEDTNLAVLPIKFAPTPFNASNTPVALIFSNRFVLATQGVYQVGQTIAGSTNNALVGVRPWTVTNGPVTVISNSYMDVVYTNSLAMATGAVQTLLPTIPGHRYQLDYSVRGPCAVGWWNGTQDALSHRAKDLISGNNGAFLNGATNTVAAFLGDTSKAFVGINGLYFTGQIEPAVDDPDIWPEDIDDPSSQIALADPPQLQFTNSFTIEAWIKPQISTNEETVCGTEMIFFRGYPEPFDCRGLGDPYWLALRPASDGNVLHRDIQFHIAAAHTGTNWTDVITTNSPIVINGGTNDGWWHVAAVFNQPYTNIVVTNGTNFVSFQTNSMRLFVNGVCLATNYTKVSPYGNLDPALSPGVSIGSRCRYDWTQPFTGLMDEVTVYARALTDPEIAAIVASGTAGPADLSTTPGKSLAQLTVSIDGVKLATSYGDNSKWTDYNVQFTALRTNSVATLRSLMPGTLLEGITLTELPSELYYLPEVSLSDLFGEDAYGVWTLEIWDTRVGLGATNLAQLIQWQLNLGLAPSNPPPVISLAHGIPYTNTLAAHDLQYFVVQVPQWATNATNVLQFANRSGTINPRPVTVLFNGTNYPNLADLALIGPASTGVSTLTTNGSPAMSAGAPYFLAVTNPNAVPVTFALSVAYDITTLTNCQLLTSNIVGAAGIPRYFQFDVPTNSTLPGVPPSAVSFWLSSVTQGVTVVMSDHLPLPDLNHYTTGSNVMFSAEACYTTNYPQIIALTNRIPFIVPSTASAFAAPPGPPQWLFYKFTVTNRVSGVLFELYNLSGDGDLVLQRAVPPTMAPYYQGSFFAGTAPEQIVLRPDDSVPDLRGEWYLGIYNNDPVPLSYTIRATLPDGNGLLTSAQTLRVGLSALTPPHGLLVSWNSVIGERYIVQFTPTLAAPVSWTNLASVVATTPLTTYEVVPAPPNGGFFRVVQVTSFQPILNVQFVPPNLVRLSWSVGFPNYRLQKRVGLAGAWVDVTYPPASGLFIIAGEYVAFDPVVAPGPTFYRLVK